jgi:hypothetical protein
MVHAWRISSRSCPSVGARLDSSMKFSELKPLQAFYDVGDRDMVGPYVKLGEELWVHDHIQGQPQGHGFTSQNAMRVRDFGGKLTAVPAFFHADHEVCPDDE